MALAAPPLPGALRPESLAEWWHLLSLDAPTVAALWCLMFAAASGVRLPWTALLLLALGTWLLYVADRLLDGLRTQPPTLLRKRHHFHAAHRRGFLAASVAAGLALLWLVAHMPSRARREDALLFLLAMVYFLLVHAGKHGSAARLPKEMAVGGIFAAATAVPAWARLTGGQARLVAPVALFAALCWLNCVAIEAWEGGPEHPAALHPSTRWAARHLEGVAACLAALALAAGAVSGRSPMRLLCLAVALSALLLLLLERKRGRSHAAGLRIAADSALLTPLIVLPWVLLRW